MPKFMVVCTFKTGITQEEIAALIPQERAAERTIMELPMAVLWDLDFYPLTAPISTP